MHWIMYHALILTLAIGARNADATPQRDACYSAWAETGIHLIMSDNGTPNDFSDDWVVDWEDNRDFIVKVYD